MDPTWLDDRGTLLGAHCPLPLNAPFTPAQAYALGVSRRAFRFMVECGLLRHVLRGVYAVTQAPTTP